jgi:hypothetical protein
MDVLRDRTQTFEKTAASLDDDDQAWQDAIDIDMEARKAIQKAIAAYDKLTLKVAESL